MERDVTTGTLGLTIRADTRRVAQGLQRMGHALERFELAFGRWRRNPERWEQLRRQHAAERMHLLERQGYQVQVVTGYDGVSRVRVVG